MTLWLILLISILTFVSKPDLINADSETKHFLKEAGCDENGNVLGKGACINKNYQNNEPPPGEHGKMIYILIYHQKILKIEEKAKEVTMDLKVKFLWDDSRIKTNFTSADSHRRGRRLTWDKLSTYPKGIKIWHPQLHFDDVSSYTLLHEPATSGTLLYNNPFNQNKTLLEFMAEFRITTYCDYILADYPMDTQLCPVRISSKNTADLELSLYDPQTNYHTDKRYEVDGFAITITFIGSHRSRLTDISSVGFNVQMKRILQPFLLQYYLTCAAIVIATTVSFLIPPSAIPGRIGLLATLFLTLTNIFIQQIVSLL